MLAHTLTKMKVAVALLIAWHIARPAVAVANPEASIGVMTGSFDPIHEGHIRTAVDAAQRLGLDKIVLFVRQAYGTKQPVAEAHRIEMLRLAAADHPVIQVAALPEVQRLAELGDEALLREMIRAAPQTRFVKIIGTDSFRSLLSHGLVLAPDVTGWDVAVIERPGYELPAKIPPYVRVIEAGQTDEVSSTQIRQALRTGVAPKMLHPRVQRYIEAHGLYGVQAMAKRSAPLEQRPAKPRPSRPRWFWRGR